MVYIYLALFKVRFGMRKESTLHFVLLNSLLYPANKIFHLSIHSGFSVPKIIRITRMTTLTSTKYRNMRISRTGKQTECSLKTLKHILCRNKYLYISLIKSYLTYCHLAFMGDILINDRTT